MTKAHHTESSGWRGFKKSAAQLSTWPQQQDLVGGQRTAAAAYRSYGHSCWDQREIVMDATITTSLTAGIDASRSAA